MSMRHGKRDYLPCLKYVRHSTPSVVSPIMRQVCKPLALSYQVGVRVLAPRRLDDPDDLVRLEIGTALARGCG